MTTDAPTWSSVLTSWTFTPVADLLLVRRLARCDGAWSWGRTTSWLAAMVVLVVALNTSMAVYAHSLFWVHMLVHLILIMVAAVLLVWAQPIRLVRVARRPDSRTLREDVIAARPFTVLTSPALGVQCSFHRASWAGTGR